MRDLCYRWRKIIVDIPVFDHTVIFAFWDAGALGIDEMLVATNTNDLGLIRDAANPLDRHTWRGAEKLAKIYQYTSKTKATETSDFSKESGPTETTQTFDVTSTFGTLPLVQSIIPHPCGMPSWFIMNSKASCTMAMTR